MVVWSLDTVGCLHLVHTYKALHDTAPLCLSDECQLLSDSNHHLRSSAALVKPWTRTRLSDRSFDVAGLQIWNKLPASTHLIEDFGYFRKLLKAHLFD